MSNSSENNLIIVGGERFWHELLPSWKVLYCRLQSTRWLLKDGSLFIAGDKSVTEVHGVLWRVGVVKPEPWHRAILELIRIAGVPCLNSAESLLRGFDKLSMYAEMRKAGLPNITASITAGSAGINLHEPQLPCVMKIENNHGGLGKARITTLEQWRDFADVAALMDDYVMLEPFIDYMADVRCLLVGKETWCMRRENEDWKVNRGKASPHLIMPPRELTGWARIAAQHLGSTILGLDFLQTQSGDWVLLECNDVPGLSGFPENVRQAVADEFVRGLQ